MSGDEKNYLKSKEVTVYCNKTMMINCIMQFDALYIRQEGKES